jgi:iron complex outermembrane recepter protein
LRLQTTRGRLLASTIICGAAVAAIATASPALAQEDSTEVEAVVVTGSRIARQDYISNSPITTVTGEQIVANADITLDTYLNTLPQINPAGTTTSNNPGNAGRANIDLRGLGAKRNLVLVDGRRPMVSSNDLTVDVNTIPQALIANVEVITGGAGATYGADAVAGVVNFKLKDNFEGIDFRASYQDSLEYQDAREYQVSLVLGGNFADGKGNAVVAFDRSFRQFVYKGQRAFSAIATSTTGTGPEGSIRWASGNPIPLAAIQTLFAGYGVAATAVGSSSGSLGFNLDGTLFYGGAPSNATLQVQNYKYPIDVSVNTRFFPDFYSYNFDALNLLTLPLDRYSFMSKVNYELDNGVEFFANVGWTEYTASSALAPTPLPTVRISSLTSTNNFEVKSALVTPGQTALTNLVVPTTNPFIPASLAFLLSQRVGDDPALVGSGATEPFLFGFRPLGFGPRLSQYQNTVVQYMGGVKVPLGDNFAFEGYVSQGRTEIDLTQFGNIDTQRLQDVLAHPTQSPGGNTACATNNFFGDRDTAAPCRAYLESPVSQKTALEQSIAQAFVSGTVMELPAGDLQVVFGGEYRGFEYSSRFLSSPGPFSGFNVGDPDAGTNAFYDIFGEALIPLAKDLPWAQTLELSLGARYSWSEFEDKLKQIGRDSRGSAAYKAEVTWAPVDFARVRASFQRAVREPNFGELFASNASAPQVFDPCSTYSQAWQKSAAAAAGNFRGLCIAQGVAAGGATTPPAGQLNISVSGNTNLAPEKANTLTLGLVVNSPFENQWLSRLRGTVDYYQIEVTDPILSIDTNTLLADCYNYFGTNPTYSNAYASCAAIKRGGGNLGSGAAIDGPDANKRFPGENGGSINTSGVDYQIDYGFDWEWLGLPSWMGSVQANLILTNVLEYTQADKSYLPEVDYTGTISYFGAGLGTSFPEWKGVFNTRWSMSDLPFGDLAIGARVRYIDGMINRQLAQFPGETFLGLTGVNPNVPATWYTDIDVTWGVTDSIEVKLGINNLADQLPRLYGPNVQSGTDPSTYDVIGRRAFGQIKLRF